jgi:hypothetical protein
MPIRYRCKRCGFIFYEYTDKQSMGNKKYWGLPSPSDVAMMYDYVCPRCGRRLSLKPTKDDIIVKPVKAQQSNTSGLKAK